MRLRQVSCIDSEYTVGAYAVGNAGSSTYNITETYYYTDTTLPVSETATISTSTDEATMQTNIDSSANQSFDLYAKANFTGYPDVFRTSGYADSTIVYNFIPGASELHIGFDYHMFVDASIYGGLNSGDADSYTYWSLDLTDVTSSSFLRNFSDYKSVSVEEDGGPIYASDSITDSFYQIITLPDPNHEYELEIYCYSDVWANVFIDEDSVANAELTISNLQVNAVPIPSALWLLGSGLIGIMGIRRKFLN